MSEIPAYCPNCLHWMVAHEPSIGCKRCDCDLHAVTPKEEA